MSLVDEILQYPLLDGPARQLLTQAVAEANDPDLDHLLREMQALSVFVQRHADLLGTPPSREAIAFFVLATHHQHRRPPPALQPIFEHLRVQLTAEPALYDQYLTFKVRLEALLAAAEPAALFTRLTGYRLPDYPAPAEAPAFHEPEAPYTPRPPAAPPEPPSAPDRPNPTNGTSPPEPQ